MIYPKQYPTVVIDDFFDNPSAIRDFALSLSYERDVEGKWPGERTPMLHTIDENLVYALAKKILSIYFDNGTHVYWDDIQMSFHKIKPYSTDRHSLCNTGWIHTDELRTFAGVVYLTPNAPTFTGTTLFKPKEKYKAQEELQELQVGKSFNFDNYEKEVAQMHKLVNEQPIQGSQDFKRKLYLGEDFDSEEYDKEITELYNKFDVVTEVKNVYNRCIQYDARQWHTGTNYWTNGEDRLSLVYFFTNVRAPFTPYERHLFHDQEIMNKINRIGEKQ